DSLADRAEDSAHVKSVSTVALELFADVVVIRPDERLHLGVGDTHLDRQLVLRCVLRAVEQGVERELEILQYLDGQPRRTASPPRTRWATPENASSAGKVSAISSTCGDSLVDFDPSRKRRNLDESFAPPASLGPGNHAGADHRLPVVQ